MDAVHPRLEQHLFRKTEFFESKWELRNFNFSDLLIIKFQKRLESKSLTYVFKIKDVYNL